MPIVFQRVLLGGFLAVIAGISLGYVVGALLTGAVNGPARGKDVVYLASQPVLFWLMVALFSVVAAAASAVAYKSLRKT